ncbi:hypothetical protein B0H17DRAFT_1145819 [Mycena rosella]|uniref:Uncharacterized protein n=1 Tax=Mycena rosella TaxID=1033263 RepID=A0AAD7G1X5_MYCRO|nr:hypothetical protein B0H17DRAFT_1145819 [Mycena rosella]
MNQTEFRVLLREEMCLKDVLEDYGEIWTRCGVIFALHVHSGRNPKATSGSSRTSTLAPALVLAHETKLALVIEVLAVLSTKQAELVWELAAMRKEKEEVESAHQDEMGGARAIDHCTFTRRI